MYSPAPSQGAVSLLFRHLSLRYEEHLCGCFQKVSKQAQAWPAQSSFVKEAGLRAAILIRFLWCFLKLDNYELHTSLFN